MPRTPSLDALRIFVVAARHLSFTEAAHELNLTQSAVSHRIRGLEDELRLELFKRLTRRLELTAHGQMLARKVGSAIGDIDRTISDLDRTERAGPLKVTMLPSVAAHWLIPRLPRIRERHAKLDVQVIADARLLDLRAEEIDLAIRFCRAPHPTYVATRLMADRIFPVCSPNLLRRYGRVDSIDALLKLPLLHDSATENDGSGTDWATWLAYHGKPDSECREGQRFSEGSMLINAAVLGLGVAMARASLVADQMASGALVCPLNLVAPTVFSYYLLGLPEAAERASIAMFRGILIEEAAETEAFMLSMDASASNRLRDIHALAAAA